MLEKKEPDLFEKGRFLLGCCRLLPSLCQSSWCNAGGRCWSMVSPPLHFSLFHVIWSLKEKGSSSCCSQGLIVWSVLEQATQRGSSCIPHSPMHLCKNRFQPGRLDQHCPNSPLIVHSSISGYMKHLGPDFHKSWAVTKSSEGTGNCWYSAPLKNQALGI